MKITFYSDAADVTSTGFNATYRVHFCNGNQQITDVTGSFTDGSGDNANYQDWSECGWVIRGVPGQRTVVTFDKFATEANYDFVTVYDGPDKTSPVIAQFSGNTIPPQVIGSIGTPMFVYFESDMTMNDAGFIGSFRRISNQTIGPERSNNCTTYTATDLPMMIPPGNATTGDTISSIMVTDSFTMGEVSLLNVRGNHTWLGDLNFYLMGPDGASVSQLVNKRCNGYPGFTFGFSDFALTASWPCPPVGGEWQPFTPLSVFNNKNSQGTWKLRVQDTEAGDNGELWGWQLRICTPVPSTVPITSGAEIPSMTTGVSHSEMTTGISQSGTTGMSRASTTGVQQTRATTGVVDRPLTTTTGENLPDSVATALPNKVYLALACVLAVYFMRFL